MKLVFSCVVKGIKIKITAKFCASRRLRFEDTKRIMSPAMSPEEVSGLSRNRLVVIEQQCGETCESTVFSLAFSLKPSLLWWILPQILEFTPHMTSYWVTYCFCKRLPYASMISKYNQHDVADPNKQSVFTHVMRQQVGRRNITWNKFCIIIESNSPKTFSLLFFCKIQLMVWYQCCVLIGGATSRLYVIAHK